MLIYTDTITPRLQYMADFSGKLLTGQPFALTTDKDFFRQAGPGKINYSAGRIDTTEFWLKPHHLLFEINIDSQPVQCTLMNGYAIFFQTEGDWPFDIFAAGFYLLSRYEEYLPHEKDMYGRYAHENSLAFKEGFLGVPLVNIWWNQFKNALRSRFSSFKTVVPNFTFLPTYDIDIAWSYNQKGWQRNLGGLASSLLRGQWGQSRGRWNVLRKKQADPYDSYGWLHTLHENFRVKPYYFFLLADPRGKYDKNISPRSRQLQELIRGHSMRYPVGIHPSWRSGDEHGLLQKEIETLMRITGTGCMLSRQHYIRFDLPTTFRRLLQAGIRYDFSMGYGSINGFRASVTTPFYWYDLEKDMPTELLLYPFCYMDANSYYEQDYTPQQALDEMREYRRIVKSVGGNMIIIWHNHFLGSEPQFATWKKVYEKFIKETAGNI